MELIIRGRAKGERSLPRGVSVDTECLLCPLPVAGALTVPKAGTLSFHFCQALKKVFLDSWRYVPPSHGRMDAG